MFDPLERTGQIALIGICLSVGIVVGSDHRILQPVKADISYSDLIAIVLTALAVLLSALAIFIAILAVFGWKTFEERLKSHSIDYFKEELSKNGKLRSEFEDLIVKIANSGIESYKNQEGIRPDNPSVGKEEPYSD